VRSFQFLVDRFGVAGGPGDQPVVRALDRALAAVLGSGILGFLRRLHELKGAPLRSRPGGDAPVFVLPRVGVAVRFHVRIHGDEVHAQVGKIGVPDEGDQVLVVGAGTGDAHQQAQENVEFLLLDPLMQDESANAVPIEAGGQAFLGRGGGGTGSHLAENLGRTEVQDEFGFRGEDLRKIGRQLGPEPDRSGIVLVVEPARLEGAGELLNPGGGVLGGRGLHEGRSGS
jgi:hypothetical protein